MTVRSSFQAFLVTTLIGATTLAVGESVSLIFPEKMNTPIEAHLGEYSDYTLKKEDYALDDGSQMQGWVLHFQASLPTKPNIEDFALLPINIGPELQLMLVRKDRLFPAVGLADGVLMPTESYDVAIPLPYSYFNESAKTDINVDDATITLIGSDKSIQIK